MTLPEIKSLFLKNLKHLYPEAEIISFFHMALEHYFSVQRVDLALQPELMRKEWAGKKLVEVLDELAREKPIQYILGTAEFAGMRYRVDKNVLIPRPETEELVYWIIDTLNARKHSKILDIGCGSGCSPVTLALKLPLAEVHALDVSTKALEIARYNAENLNATVQFERINILEADRLDEMYEVIVSNPPYVRFSEKSLMRGNVLKHEPEIALFVNDEDPLLFYRNIASLAKDGLKSNGILFFEINEELAESTCQILEAFEFQNIEVRKDIYGRDRMIRAFKK